MTEKCILDLIRGDDWMMSILREVAALNLPDWAVGAGFVRGKAWDCLHDFKERTPLPDIDVLYFNPTEKIEGREIEAKLGQRFPGLAWEAVNQATAHIYNDEDPYRNTEDAVSKWPETATAVAVTMDSDGGLKLIAPHGVKDLVEMKVRPTPAWEQKLDKYKKRAEKKAWDKKWPKVKVWLPE